jgi:hypothetical protein
MLRPDTFVRYIKERALSVSCFSRIQPFSPFSRSTFLAAALSRVSRVPRSSRRKIDEICQMLKPDTSFILAKEKLGWEPKISLEQGLRKTIEYFERKLSEEKK